MGKDFKNQVIETSTGSLAVRLIDRIGSLIFTIIIARIFLPELFGLYNIALSITFIFIILSEFGINTALIRYVSYYFGKNKKTTAASYSKYLFKIKIISSLFAAITLLIISGFLANTLFSKPDLFYPILLSAFYVLVFSIESFFEAFFYAFRRIRYLMIKESIFQTLKILSIFFIVLLLPRTSYVSAIILLPAVILLFLIVFLYYSLKKKFSFIFEKTKSKPDKKRIITFLKYITLANISALFFSYIDTLTLGIFLPSEYVGYYRAAFSLVIGIANILSFGTVFISVFTQINGKKLNNYFNKITKYALLITIPCSFGLILFARYFLLLIFGKSYLDSLILIYILSFLIVEIAVGGILSSLLSSKEKTKEFAKLTLISLVINIVLNVVFILYFIRFSNNLAMFGVAIATLISRYFNFFGLIYLCKKKLKARLAFSNIFVPFAFSLFIFSIFFYINQKITLNPAIVIFEFILFIAIYFALLLLTRTITKQEILVFKNIRKSEKTIEINSKGL